MTQLHIHYVCEQFMDERTKYLNWRIAEYMVIVAIVVGNLCRGEIKTVSPHALTASSTYDCVIQFQRFHPRLHPNSTYTACMPKTQNWVVVF